MRLTIYWAVPITTSEQDLLSVNHEALSVLRCSERFDGIASAKNTPLIVAIVHGSVNHFNSTVLISLYLITLHLVSMPFDGVICEANSVGSAGMFVSMF